MTSPLSVSWATDQLRIFSAVKAEGRSVGRNAGNFLVSAVAGSGKTTTLVEAVRHVPRKPGNLLAPSVLFLAFNKAIAETLQQRIGTAGRASTFHALGLSALKQTFPKIKVDTRKASAVIYRLFKRDHPDTKTALRALSLLKSFWPLPSSQSEAATLLQNNDVDFEDPKSLGKVLVALGETVRDTSSCDFDDMLVMPLVHDSPFKPQDFVLVDEAQDTNDVQLEILERLCKVDPRAALMAQLTASGGVTGRITSFSPTRFLFVGDPAQAIYGFRGANSDSMERIKKRFGCTSLPLSVTYRCPRLHVTLARKYSGEKPLSFDEMREAKRKGEVSFSSDGTEDSSFLIRAREDAPLGTILRPERFAPTIFLPGSAVLCRNTAPLVRFCYDLLQREIPCHIAGKEIGAGLAALARSFKVEDTASLRVKLSKWHFDKVEDALAEGRSAERYTDQYEALVFLCDGLSSVEDVCRRISRLFDDSAPASSVLLSTIHKAKGGEWDRVFLLDFDKLLPSRYARLPWQRVQERNLQYVAVTRSKDTLVFIESEKWEEETSATKPTP